MGRGKGKLHLVEKLPGKQKQNKTKKIGEQRKQGGWRHRVSTLPVRVVLEYPRHSKKVRLVVAQRQGGWNRTSGHLVVLLK